MAKIIAGAIIGFYGLLLLGTPLMLVTAFLVGLFGLPAYGLTLFGRIQVGIFIFACVTLPVALLVSMCLSIFSWRKNNLFRSFLQLCIPLPHFIYFVGLFAALVIAKWDTLTHHLFPQTGADYYANSRFSHPMPPGANLIDNLTKAIDLSDPKSKVCLGAHIARAFNYAQAGKNEEAIADYQWFLNASETLDEENMFTSRTDVIESIALLLAREGKYKDALALIDKEIARTTLAYQIEGLLKGRAQIDEAIGDQASAAEDLSLSKNTRKLLAKYPQARRHEPNRGFTQTSKVTSIYELDSFGNTVKYLNPRKEKLPVK